MPAAGQPLVVRPINAQTGAIRSGVGSAVFEVGSTRVVCAVYGPQVDARQEFSERGRLACEVKVAAFARPARSASAPPTGAEESAFAAELHTALSPSLRLDAYPKSSWQLCAFVVEDDGSALPALINCASLALADAGIQMFDMVAACSVVRAARPSSVPLAVLGAPPRLARSRAHAALVHTARAGLLSRRAGRWHADG